MAELLITKADRGGQIDVRVGDTILIRLDENATTGFQWQFDSIDSTTVAYEGSEYLGQQTGIGGGDVRCMKFKAKAAGTSEIRLKSCQAWEPNEVADTFEVTIRVAS